MRLIGRLFIAFAMLAGLAAGPALAGATDPLFVNLTTDEGHRANMAITFGAKQHARGHALTIFLNDKGVLVGSKAHAEKFGDRQKDLLDAMSKGATVLICPMCMKHYKVNEADLLPGIKVGSPEVTGAALFKDHTQTLTW